MPHFTLQITPNGPLLDAVAYISQPRLAALQAANLPTPAAVPIRALVDTGASCTCMDPSVLTALQLTPSGTVSIISPTTGAQPHTAFQYDMSILIPPATAQQTPLVFQNIAVTETQLLVQQGFHALIGRDILQHCVLVYNGTMAQFTLAY